MELKEKVIDESIQKVESSEDCVEREFNDDGSNKKMETDSEIEKFQKKNTTN